ncbi:hypothetical protein OF829_11250 [Sphingomonas sp. LB-2]|uniref:hypothetical protein n=1 Tax=Sphingomonas caeni TaxID=2984949 RepID=UPI00222F4F76|nr:hypothetical protein [Sphingomonas caeni]MCW3847816.1 hypothetical protein [Sphingomonas caeni]
MKWTAMIALALAGIPVAAQAQTQVDEKVGSWSVQGKGGDCIVGTFQPGGMVMVTAPASGGENHGGFMISQREIEVPDGPGATLETTGTGSFSGTRPMIGYSDVPAYWVSFPSDDTIDGFSDNFRVKVSRDGETIIDVSVSGFTEARAALRRCIAKTR